MLLQWQFDVGTLLVPFWRRANPTDLLLLGIKGKKHHFCPDIYEVQQESGSAFRSSNILGEQTVHSKGEWLETDKG